MAETIIAHGEGQCPLHSWEEFNPPEHNKSRRCKLCGELRADMDAIMADTSTCWYCGKWDYDVKIIDSAFIECTCKNCGRQWERAIA